MRKLTLLALPVVMLLSSCTPNQAAVWLAQRELGKTELSPEPYMYGIQAAQTRTLGFWCDEFVAEMLKRSDHELEGVYNGDPGELARMFPIAEPPYQPGDLVFVTYNASRVEQRYDHMGILQHAEGDHLWDIEGNWPTGRLKPNGKSLQGVVLNERWVGDGAVTEIRRP